MATIDEVSDFFNWEFWSCPRHGHKDYDPDLNKTNLARGKHGHYRLESFLRRQVERWYRKTEVPKSMNKVIKEHFDIEESTCIISVYSNLLKDAFLFIEVNDEAIPVGNIEPFYFAPNNEFEWPLYLASVTRDEWAKVQTKTMALPQGWISDPLYIFRREEVLG